MNQRIRIGINKRSLNRALNNVTLIKHPIVTLGGCIEKSITKKPKNKIILVKQIALPVSVKVMSKASSILFPAFLASLYLLKK